MREHKMITAEPAETGHAVYTPAVLRSYDWLVHRISNHLLWRCPTSELRRLYDRNVSYAHVDIGVATGYFLDKARWPVATPSITLIDLNQNCLDAASGRLRRYTPHTVLADALKPLPALGPFRSAGLCYLFHTIPGTITEKAIAFDHLKPVLAPGASVFGATILQGSLPRSKAAQALMNVYNKKGIFSNARDNLEDLDAALRQRFVDVRITVKGTVALFEAKAG
jgi:hypothetical protein